MTDLHRIAATAVAFVAGCLAGGAVAEAASRRRKRRVKFQFSHPPTPNPSVNEQFEAWLQEVTDLKPGDRLRAKNIRRAKGSSC